MPFTLSVLKKAASAAVGVVALTVAVPMGAQTGAAPLPAPGTASIQARRDQILAYHTEQGQTGSPEAGRPLFEQRCALCHRFGGIGKDVGPDLTTITSRFKKKDVLESILWPSKVISDQYQSEMFELNDGTVVAGVIVRETAAAVLVRTAANPDKPVAIAKGQLAGRTPATVSLMPETLLDDLDRTQIGDLLAFIMAPPPK